MTRIVALLRRGSPGSRAQASAMTMYAVLTSAGGSPRDSRYPRRDFLCRPSHNAKASSNVLRARRCCGTGQMGLHERFSLRVGHQDSQTLALCVDCYSQIAHSCSPRCERSSGNAVLSTMAHRFRGEHETRAAPHMPRHERPSWRTSPPCPPIRVQKSIQVHVMYFFMDNQWFPGKNGTPLHVVRSEYRDRDQPSPYSGSNHGYTKQCSKTESYTR